MNISCSEVFFIQSCTKSTSEVRSHKLQRTFYKSMTIEFSFISSFVQHSTGKAIWKVIHTTSASAVDFNRNCMLQETEMDFSASIIDTSEGLNLAHWNTIHSWWEQCLNSEDVYYRIPANRISNMMCFNL